MTNDKIYNIRVTVKCYLFTYPWFLGRSLNNRNGTIRFLKLRQCNSRETKRHASVDGPKLCYHRRQNLFDDAAVNVPTVFWITVNVVWSRCRCFIWRLIRLLNLRQHGWIHQRRFLWLWNIPILSATDSSFYVSTKFRKNWINATLFSQWAYFGTRAPLFLSTEKQITTINRKMYAAAYRYLFPKKVSDEPKNLQTQARSLRMLYRSRITEALVIVYDKYSDVRDNLKTLAQISVHQNNVRPRF